MPYAAAASELIAHGISADRTKVIPFCVDEDLFSGLASEPPSGGLTLVMSARMFPGKGHLELLASLATLSPRYAKLRAIFIGDGPTRPDVEAEIARLNLGQIVKCRGRVGHREVPAIMHYAKRARGGSAELHGRRDVSALPDRRDGAWASGNWHAMVRNSGNYCGRRIRNCGRATRRSRISASHRTLFD